MWPCLLTLRKGSKHSRPSVWGNFSPSPTWNTRPTTRCGPRSTILWAHRNLFWQLPRDRNPHGTGMSRAVTASPELSFRTPSKGSLVVVCRGHAGWTESKSGRPCPCQNYPSGHPRRGAWLWSAEDMLDGQNQRVDVPAHARTAHMGLLQKRPEENICWIVPHVPPTIKSLKGLSWTESTSPNYSKREVSKKPWTS